jgi:multiple sugar transport system ATP-binding protein
MASVIFENVEKSYGKVKAIQPVSFEVKDKELLVLVGPSGCGKSTLLRMIAGLEDISSGQIKIDDKVVNDLPPKDRDIAIVFQNYALYPHMTAYDNMAFGLKIRRFSKAIIQEKVMEAARILDIEDLLQRKPKAMSGGQRQRIAIGRAIVRNPKVFLFDEPLSNLDAQLRGQMRLEIASLHRRLKATMVYVTHDQVEAMTLGDRIVVLEKGLIQQIDTPQNLYNHPANIFVAGFIGSPKMNFIPGRISEKEGKIIYKSNSGQISIPIDHSFKKHENRAVVLGIRPEHLYSKNNKVKNGVGLITEVKWIELLGHDGFAFFEIEGRRLSARLKADELQKPPFKQDMLIDVEKIHFFDAENGQAI